MKGDEKRTIGEILDDAIRAKYVKTVKVTITITPEKTESPEPGKPAKETR